MHTIKGEKVDQGINFNLLNEAQCILSDMDLTSIRMQDFLVVIKSDFDFTFSGEPYIALMMVLDLKTGKYILRLWNQTIAAGSALRKEELLEACTSLFSQGRPCFGFPVTETPFPRKVASTCRRELGKDTGSDVIACHECSRLKTLYSMSDAQIKEEPCVNSERTNSQLEANHPLKDYIAGGEFMEGDNLAWIHDADPGKEDSKEWKLEEPEHNSEDGEEQTHFKQEGSTPDETDTNENHTSNKRARKRKMHVIGDEGSPLDDKSTGINCSTKKQVFERKTCPVCNKSYSHSKYYEHLKKKHFYGRFTCAQCGVKKRLAADLVLHMKEQEHMQDQFVACPSCQTTVHFDEIEPHYKVCVKPKGQLCPECGKTIVGQGREMKRHMAIHMRQQGLTNEEAKTTLYHYCDKCGIRSTSRENLGIHQKVMHSNGPFPCAICGKEFARYNMMRQHKMNVHNPLQCEHCEYTTGTRAALKLHTRKHFDPKFKCSYCDKMLKTELNLKAHERGHTGETPFKCTVCGKGFKADNTLRTHRKHVHKILTPGMKPIEKRVRKPDFA